MTLLSIDPSSTCCGAAVFADGKLVDAWRIKPERRKDDATTRVTSMIAELRDLMREHGVVDVVIEEPALVAMPGRHKANAVMQRAFARIFQAALDTGAAVHAVQINTWARGRSKRLRASVIKNHDAETDKGLDGADAIGLGQWWLARQRVASPVAEVRL
jgi:hypothetical protein